MYSEPHQFEPLLPSLAHPELDALAEDVCRRGFELKRLVHPITEARIATLLRSVNSLTVLSWPAMKQLATAPLPLPLVGEREAFVADDSLPGGEAVLRVRVAAVSRRGEERLSPIQWVRLLGPVAAR